jgi:hypothetical protein
MQEIVVQRGDQQGQFGIHGYSSIHNGQAPIVEFTGPTQQRGFSSLETFQVQDQANVVEQNSSHHLYCRGRVVTFDEKKAAEDWIRFVTFQEVLSLAHDRVKIDAARVPVQVHVAWRSSLWPGLVFARGVKNWLDSAKRLSEQTLCLGALVPLQENSGKGVQLDNVVAPLHV